MIDINWFELIPFHKRFNRPSCQRHVQIESNFGCTYIELWRSNNYHDIDLWVFSRTIRQCMCVSFYTNENWLMKIVHVFSFKILAITLNFLCFFFRNFKIEKNHNKLNAFIFLLINKSLTINRSQYENSKVYNAVLWINWHKWKKKLLK